MQQAEQAADPWRTAVVLEGAHVRLEPLLSGHIAPLAEIGTDPELWRWTPTRVDTAADMAAFVMGAHEQQAAGAALAFATRDRASGSLAGSTRFGAMEPAHRRVEIGWTWLARPWQRTALNTEAKYLMLRYAFETMGCVRVELKTDALNEPSRRAIRRIGAVEEGVLRQHMVMPDGRLRDTVYYSILHTEWPRVRARLEEMLATARTPHPSSTPTRDGS